MPTSMRIHNKGLSPRINGDPKNPSVEADFWAERVNENETLDDVLVEVLKFAPPQVLFRTPNLIGPPGSTYFQRLYIVGVRDQRMVGPHTAECTVMYGQSEAAPAPSQGGPDPGNDNGEGNGPPPEEVLGPEWKFSTQGGTKHITQSIKTRHRKLYKAGVADEAAEAPDVQNVIGVSRERVEGCDIGTGQLNWSYTLKGAQLQWDKRNYYKDMTYTVNSERFLNIEPGELLFTGMDANYSETEGWTMTFNFSERKNESLILYTAGGAPITNPVIKNGHDYAWFVYEDRLIGTAPDQFMVQKPVAVYIEQVYEEKPFKDLFKV